MLWLRLLVKQTTIEEDIQKRIGKTRKEMMKSSSASGEASGFYDNINNNNINVGTYPPHYDDLHPTNPQPSKKKRNQPGHPDPDAEVIALSPRSLLATNRFVCDVCNKGFQRDQNLQLHRRGHNLPWKLKQRNNKEVIKKKVYVCPETSCVHHDPSRALGDLTGIKKHFCRKHGKKKWKCDKCSKKYAVQSDWKAHSKTCGTREYRCDCGTLFSRRDSFITHRAFCDALAEESARSTTILNNKITTTSIPQQNSTTCSSTVPIINNPNSSITHHINLQQLQSQFNNNSYQNQEQLTFQIKKEQHQNFPPWISFTPPQLTMVGPPPPQHIDQLATSSVLFQDFQQHNDSTTHHQDHHKSNPNPASTLGPTTTTPLLPPYINPPTPPHISATALLQKAAQLGAKSSGTTTTAKNQSLSLTSSLQQGGGNGIFITTAQPHLNEVSSASDSSHWFSTTSSTTAGKFGLNLSSFDQFVNGLTSFGNNKAAVMSSSTNVSLACETSNNSLLHDMMMSNGTNDDYGLVGSTAFEDVAFGGILIGNNNNNNHHLHHALAKKEEHVILHGDDGDDGKNHQVGGGEIIKHDEMMMTRDFLGLRPLSESDMLSITGLSNCMGNDHCDHENQVQKSWQDN